MKRGEIWWVNFDPARGSEIKKIRPAIIVSNNDSNLFLDRFQVVPITSNASRLFPSEAYVTVNGDLGKAMADQLTTVSKKRFSKCIGKISAEDMEAVDRAIQIQLAIFKFT